MSTTKELATIAADRGLEPKKLSGTMRGDLDWIVMKCLEKDRNRRYETANGLALDVERFLDDEPVLAVPPSTTYRVRKFMRKNRAMLTTAAAIVALLFGGIAVSTWQAIRATRAESTAQENERNAEQERQIAEAVRKFLDVDLLSQADPGAEADALISTGGMSEDSKQNPTIRELLDRAASELATERIEKHFPNQPLVQAEILRTVGHTYMQLGEYPKAIEMLKRSTELFQRYRGVDHPRTLSSMGELAYAYLHAEAIDLALPLAEQTLRLWKAKPDRNDSNMIRVMGSLGDIYSNLGLREKSVEITEEAYQLAKTTLGSNNKVTLIMMRELAKIYSRADRDDLATPLMEQALQLEIANLGSDHVITLMGMYSLALLYEHSGKLELALPLSEEVVRLSAAKFGAEHPNTLLFKSNLGGVYRMTGKLDKSMTILEETLQAAKRKLGPNHTYTLHAMSNLAATYRDAGKPELGLPLQEEVLRLQRSKQGHAHPDTLVVMDQLDQLATMYVQEQKLDRAAPLLEEEVTLKKEKLGPSDRQTLLSIRNLAAVYMQQGKSELAVSSYEELVKLTKAKLGPENTETVGAMETLAEVYLETAARQAWLTEHKKWEETCQTAIRFAEGANNPVILERAAKACSLFPSEDSDQRAKAMVLARKAVELGKKHQWLPFFQLTLGMAEYRSGHYQEADAALDSACKLVHGKGQLVNIAAFYHAMSLFHQGKQDEARKIAASAAAKMKPLPHDEKSPQSHDALIEWLAYKEAKAMIPELAMSSDEELVKLTKAKLGPENTETVGAMERLAEVYLGTAARQAWLTEHKKWEETCQTAIRFAEGANNPVILERAAKACSLFPSEDSDQRAKAMVLARKAVELGKNHQWLPFFQLTLGMAEYRSGHYQEADAALDSACKLVHGKGQLVNIAAFYHAMSPFHQGKQDEARKIAASAAAKMKPLPQDVKSPQSHDALIEWLAYKEAQAMMP